MATCSTPTRPMHAAPSYSATPAPFSTPRPTDDSRISRTRLLAGRKSRPTGRDGGRRPRSKTRPEGAVLLLRCHNGGDIHLDDHLGERQRGDADQRVGRKGDVAPCVLDALPQGEAVA